jgi:hypothetical protein
MLWGDLARGMKVNQPYAGSICPKTSTFFGQIELPVVDRSRTAGREWPNKCTRIKGKALDTGQSRSAGLVDSRPMVNPEHQFAKELELFRRESEAASQYLLAYLSTHDTARTRPAVLRALNENAMFWNTVASALQVATFMALGRVFDQESPHNLDRLVGLAHKHPSIFSIPALARRKQGTSAEPPPWLGEYLLEVYEPKAEDFRLLKRQVAAQRRVYESRYRAIRHLMAHATVVDGEAKEVWGKGNTEELKGLVGFLSSLYAALWGLFIDGRKPVVGPASLRDEGIGVQTKRVLARLVRLTRR